MAVAAAAAAAAADADIAEAVQSSEGGRLRAVGAVTTAAQASYS